MVNAKRLARPAIAAAIVAASVASIVGAIVLIKDRDPESGMEIAAAIGCDQSVNMFGYEEPKDGLLEVVGCKRGGEQLEIFVYDSESSKTAFKTQATSAFTRFIVEEGSTWLAFDYVRWCSAGADRCEKEPAEEATAKPAPDEAAIEPKLKLRTSAPQGNWKLVKLTANSFGKGYGYWYLEDEDFKAGRSLLKVSSLDVEFVVEDCTDTVCTGHIDPGSGAANSESQGHLYPWAGEGQEHTFTWDGQKMTISTHADETEGVCYDTETGEDLPGTSWTDTATYKYSAVNYTRPSGKSVADSVNAEYRVDYKTVFVPYCEGPTTMFVEGSIAFERAQ